MRNLNFVLRMRNLNFFLRMRNLNFFLRMRELTHAQNQIFSVMRSKFLKNFHFLEKKNSGTPLVLGSLTF